MAGPHHSAADQADTVPDDMKVLSSVLDMFNDHPLVVEHPIAVFLFAAFNNGENLLVGQRFALHRVDTDMMQRLSTAGATGDFPHFLECLIEVLGFRIAQFDKARLLVLTLLLHIVGGGSITAPDMGFDNQ